MALLAHVDSDAKLQFLTRTVNGTPWSLHASIRLPAVHTYAELVESLFQTFRLLRLHSVPGPKAQAEPFHTMKDYYCDKIKLAAYALFRATLEDAHVPTLFLGLMRLCRDPRNIGGDIRGPGHPTVRRERASVRPPQNRCFICWKRGCSTRTCPKPRDLEHIERNIEDCWEYKGPGKPSRSSYISYLAHLKVAQSSLARCYWNV